MTFLHMLATILLVLGGVCIIQLRRNWQDEGQRGAWIILTFLSLALGGLFMPLPY